jgi:hypothetical protein
VRPYVPEGGALAVLRRLLIVIAAIPTAVVVLLLITANYSDQAGVHYISRPPIAVVSWGPSQRYIVQHGLNVVGDNGRRVAGNFLEFPMPGDARVSIRFVSVRWYRQAFAGWASNHRWAAQFLGLSPSGQACESEPGCRQRPAPAGSS